MRDLSVLLLDARGRHPILVNHIRSVFGEVSSRGSSKLIQFEVIGGSGVGSPEMVASRIRNLARTRFLMIFCMSPVLKIDGDFYVETSNSKGKKKNSYVPIDVFSAENVVSFFVDEGSGDESECVLVLETEKIRNFVDDFYKYFIWMPDFLIAHPLRLALEMPINLGSIDANKCERLRQLLKHPVRGIGASEVWALDPSNFGSSNAGSREDGIQSLLEVIQGGGRAEAEGRFIARHFAYNDTSEFVRRAAQDALAAPVSPRVASRIHISNKQSEILREEWCYIPGGSFLMGSDPLKDSHALREEMPQHELSLDDFYMAKCPVSELSWRIYLELNGRSVAELAAPRAGFPVTYVSWYDAVEYARWYQEAVHKDGDFSEFEVVLPSEAEWEKAARGANGNIYPWGMQYLPERCNCREENNGVVLSCGRYRGAGDSPYGLHDMAGNVWEWTRSLWGRSGRMPEYRYPYNPNDGREFLEAPPSVRRVVRGGAYYYFDYCVRAATRNVMFPRTRHSGGGFRLALRRR